LTLSSVQQFVAPAERSVAHHLCRPSRVTLAVLEVGKGRILVVAAAAVGLSTDGRLEALAEFRPLLVGRKCVVVIVETLAERSVVVSS